MNFKGAAKKITPGLAVGAGVIGSGYAKKFIPVANEKVKSLVIGGLGLLLAASKNKMAEGFGYGLFGGACQQFAQSMGIGGDDTMIAAPEVLISEVETDMGSPDDPDAAY